MDQYDAMNRRRADIGTAQLDERRPERLAGRTAVACSQATFEVANVQASRTGRRLEAVTANQFDRFVT